MMVYLLVLIDKGSNASLPCKAGFAPLKYAAHRCNCVVLLKYTASLLRQTGVLSVDKVRTYKHYK